MEHQQVPCSGFSEEQVQEINLQVGSQRREAKASRAQQGAKRKAVDLKKYWPWATLSLFLHS